MLGIFSVDEDSVVFQYLFAILNSLQVFYLCYFMCYDIKYSLFQHYEGVLLI